MVQKGIEWWRENAVNQYTLLEKVLGPIMCDILTVVLELPGSILKTYSLAYKHTQSHKVLKQMAHHVSIPYSKTMRVLGKFEVGCVLSMWGIYIYLIEHIEESPGCTYSHHHNRKKKTIYNTWKQIYMPVAGYSNPSPRNDRSIGCIN